VSGALARGAGGVNVPSAYRDSPVCLHGHEFLTWIPQVPQMPSSLEGVITSCLRGSPGPGLGDFYPPAAIGASWQPCGASGVHTSEVSVLDARILHASFVGVRVFCPTHPVFTGIERKRRGGLLIYA
jgi:hypothetical protein